MRDITSSLRPTLIMLLVSTLLLGLAYSAAITGIAQLLSPAAANGSPALVPLALKGVAYKPVGAGALLARNLTIYGLGGLVAPFVGIKAIDLAVAALHLA